VSVMSEAAFETRAIPVWHITIFAILCFYMVIGVFAIFSGIAGSPIIFIFFVFFGSLFFSFLFSILVSKLKVYDDGISFRMYHVGFDEISRIRLRWGGRLMTYGKKLDLGYILLNPEKFVEAVKASGIQKASNDVETNNLFHNPFCFPYGVVGDWIRFRLHRHSS
jgi:hypothetical protein